MSDLRAEGEASNYVVYVDDRRGSLYRKNALRGRVSAANRCTRARSSRAYTHPYIDTSAVQRRVMRRHKRARFVAATRRAHARGYARVKSTTCVRRRYRIAVYGGMAAGGRG